MLKKLFIYILIGIILTLAPLYYINNIILGDEKIIKKNIVQNKSHKSSMMSFISRGTEVPDTAKNIAVTYDGSFVTYIDSDVLYIEDSKNDKIYDTVKEEEPIIYATPLNDRNIIMYFTYNDETLVIKTYDIDKKEITEHKSFRAINVQEISDVRYSSFTNVIYINAKTNKYGSQKNNIYRVDIMKNVSLYIKGKAVKNMALLNNKDTLIYEDKNNKIHIKSKVFEYDNLDKFKLLGVDDQDRIYLLSLEDEKTIFVVKDKEVVDRKYINNEDSYTLYNRNNRIYLIYNDYIYDIINDKKIKYKPNTQIIDINDENIVYKNIDNKIIIDKI